MSIVRRGVKRNNSGLLCLSDSKNDVFVWKKRLADSENTETKGKKVIQISSPVGLRPEVYRPLSEVQHHKCEQFSSKIFMVLEYVPGGDLLTFIQQNGCQPEGASRYWMLQLISAVSYMHAKGVAHRDLKLENVLIDRNGNLKITDFGFCRQMDSDQGDSFLSRTYCGSKAYSAPEILQGIQYDPFKADVWSLGVLGFILVTGRMPFNEHVSHQSVIVEAQRNRSYRYPSKLNISSHCKQTIDTMMTFDWRDRPDIFFVKNLSWIKRPSVQDILP